MSNYHSSAQRRGSNNLWTPRHTNEYRASCLALQKRPKFPKTRGIRLPEDHRTADEWTPYPIQGESRPAHTHSLINHFADINDISWDASNYLFGQDGMHPWNDLEAAIRGWHARLTKWLENLPECLHYKTDPSPGVLVLQYALPAPSLRCSTPLKAAACTTTP